jgi:uncharacterized protein YxjI
MGLLRRDKHDDVPVALFQMRQRMLSIGDDYWIEDGEGALAFKVDGKAMRIRDTWELQDHDGREVAKIREKKLSIRDKIRIELADGREATVRKKLIGFRDRFHVEVDGSDDLEVHGNIVDHEYEIERDGHKIAEISKAWFRVRDTYGVEVRDARETVLVLAVTVAVDAMSHEVA